MLLRWRVGLLVSYLLGLTSHYYLDWEPGFCLGLGAVLFILLGTHWPAWRVAVVTLPIVVLAIGIELSGGTGVPVLVFLGGGIWGAVAFAAARTGRKRGRARPMVSRESKLADEIVDAFE